MEVVYCQLSGGDVKEDIELLSLLHWLHALKWRDSNSAALSLVVAEVLSFDVIVF